MDDAPVLPPCVLINENQSINTNDRKVIRDAGVEHIAAMTSGYETAKKLAKKPDYHVILIVGERLADMTGEQFCDIIRLHPKLSALPILLLVSQESTKLEMQTLGTRASAILVRPFSVDSMRKALTDLAGKTKTIPPNSLTASETNFHACLDNLETLLRPSRHGPDDLYKVGMKCLQQKKWDNAIRAFKEALASPTLKGEAELGLAAAFTGKKSPRESAFWLAQAAETMVGAGRWNIARAIFSRIAMTNPRARNPFFLLARRQINQKEYALAAKTLAEGLDTLSPPLVSEKMAELCATANDPKRMLGLLEKELDRHPAIDSTIRPALRESFERKCQEAEERALLASLQRKEDLSRRLGLAPKKNAEQEAKAKEKAWDLEETASQKTPPNYEALGLIALPGDTVDKKKPQNDTHAEPEEPEFGSHSGLFGDIVQIIRMTYSLMRNS
ncbi:MAG: response regulator [Desulfovibrionaceae bacterium]|nr:response regulator [Desulfovibrionaceae bacterium]